MNNNTLSLIHITTVPQTLNFLRGQVCLMIERGFEVHAISSPGEQLNEFGEREQITVTSISMTREISPFRDLISLWNLYREMKRLQPVIVHAHTPKAGLLGMIAATLARVPVRIYHIRGLPLLTKAGWKRQVLQWTEWLSCRLAHRVISVGHSLENYVVEEKICLSHRITTLLYGSGNGVDSQIRFCNTDAVQQQGRTIRKGLGIPQNAVVLGFVGRLVKDKGIHELVDAWKELRSFNNSLHLLIVGELESEDAVSPHVYASLEKDKRIHLVGFQKETAPYYSAMDIFTLPTYREGHPNAPMEAAAMEVPVVATNVIGCVDAVQDGVTGALVPARDAVALEEAIQKYIDSPELRYQHGQAGRARVVRDFQPEQIWNAIHAEYLQLLAQKNLSPPSFGLTEKQDNRSNAA